MDDKNYIAIDLKSFYASVECVSRGLNPLTTNLVVADASRTEKTICLAVTPSLKGMGISGRPRLFEVIQSVRNINQQRMRKTYDGKFKGKSVNVIELQKNPDLALDFIVASPRMALYLKTSGHIYDIYLQYVAPEDIHVYSVDEVFIDVSKYLKTYHATARELAQKMIDAVLKSTGITATVGIGSNLYLAKIAMDVLAKKMTADANGARIAELDEISYRRQLWDYKPITDFWRVGKGYAERLAQYGIFTMGDIARCSIGSDNGFYNEDFLYKLFGVNAELLIDHAWGWEPCTMQDIKSYVPKVNSLCSGQVLQDPYECDKAKLVVKEMTDQLILDLVSQNMVTNQMILTVGYDIENLTDQKRKQNYHGEITVDGYGRAVPKAAHGTVSFKYPTSDTEIIELAVMNLYDRIVNKNLLVRRINIEAGNIIQEKDLPKGQYEQLDLFTTEDEREGNRKWLERGKNRQKAILNIQAKYGKNAMLKGMDLEEGATTRQRNEQIGGHKA